MKMNKQIVIHQSAYKEYLYAADLIVIDGMVMKDRTGGFGGSGTPIQYVPADGFENVKCENMVTGGTILSFSGESGIIVVIATKPIKFQQIR